MKDEACLWKIQNSTNFDIELNLNKKKAVQKCYWEKSVSDTL